MPEFYEVVHAKVRGGAEEEMLSRRPALEAGEIHGFLPEGIAHHRGEVAGG
jgi:phosphate starvation-inducible protein PhoH